MVVKSPLCVELLFRPLNTFFGLDAASSCDVLAPFCVLWSKYNTHFKESPKSRPSGLPSYKQQNPALVLKAHQHRQVLAGSGFSLPLQPPSHGLLGAPLPLRRADAPCGACGAEPQARVRQLRAAWCRPRRSTRSPCMCPMLICHAYTGGVLGRTVVAFILKNRDPVTIHMSMPDQPIWTLAPRTNAIASEKSR